MSLSLLTLTAEPTRWMSSINISELLEYREDIEENEYATDALRYSSPLEQEEKPFLCMVTR